MVVENAAGNRTRLHKVTELTSAEQSAISALSANVYPPEEVADWKGKSIEWSSAQWCAVYWSPDGQALSYAGAIIRTGTLNQAIVKIGGIGGVKTHISARRQGLASETLERILDFFKEQEADFALLVCGPDLVPLYERLDWQSFEGDVLVTQWGEKSKFIFNLSMTHPVCALGPTGGVIDLMGPPW
jgi:Acetyltransferase (GNAT) domain